MVQQGPMYGYHFPVSNSILATLGARLFLPPPLSASLGWNIRVGYDFPPATQAKLESWDLTLIIDKETEQPSTRGLLEYEDTTFGREMSSYRLHTYHTLTFYPSQEVQVYYLPSEGLR